MSRAQDYYTLVKSANKKVWDGVNELEALQREWNAMDYGSTLADGSGDHAGLTHVEVGAVVFAAADAIVTTLNTGVATNMAKLL